MRVFSIPVILRIRIHSSISLHRNIIIIIIVNYPIMSMTLCRIWIGTYSTHTCYYNYVLKSDMFQRLCDWMNITWIIVEFNNKKMIIISSMATVLPKAIAFLFQGTHHPKINLHRLSKWKSEHKNAIIAHSTQYRIHLLHFLYHSPVAASTSITISELLLSLLIIESSVELNYTMI